MDHVFKPDVLTLEKHALAAREEAKAARKAHKQRTQEFKQWRKESLVVPEPEMPEPERPEPKTEYISTASVERIYVRGSDDRINTDNQLGDLRRSCPDGVVYEDTLSGSKKRTNLERMIQESSKGDTVWIWSLDRLTREGVLATLEYLKRLTAKHVRVRSFKEPWLDTDNPCYEILVSCMAFAAKMERDRMIERTTTGIRRQRMQSGKPVLDKRDIAHAHGSCREVAERYGCAFQYVAQCRKEFGL